MQCGDACYAGWTSTFHNLPANRGKDATSQTNRPHAESRLSRSSRLNGSPNKAKLASTRGGLISLSSKACCVEVSTGHRGASDLSAFNSLRERSYSTRFVRDIEYSIVARTTWKDRSLNRGRHPTQLDSRAERL